MTPDLEWKMISFFSLCLILTKVLHKNSENEHYWNVNYWEIELIYLKMAQKCPKSSLSHT